MARDEEALTHHNRALDLSLQTGNRYRRACAHRGLVAALELLGRAEAGHHQQQALTIFDAIGSPEADEIRVAMANAATADQP